MTATIIPLATKIHLIVNCTFPNSVSYVVNTSWTDEIGDDDSAF